MAERLRSSKRDVGKRGEDIACEFLARKGYKILDRNFRRKWGEIDIVAEKEGTMRFVEVKAVSVGDFSREIMYRPEELLHTSKLEKVARTASLYMEEAGDTREYQIDGVTVVLNEGERTARCRLFEQILS